MYYYYFRKWNGFFVVARLKDHCFWDVSELQPTYQKVWHTGKGFPSVPQLL
jgi:hypothetical protein